MSGALGFPAQSLCQRMAESVGSRVRILVEPGVSARVVVEVVGA